MMNEGLENVLSLFIFDKLSLGFFFLSIVDPKRILRNASQIFVSLALFQFLLLF